MCLYDSIPNRETRTPRMFFPLMILLQPIPDIEQMRREARIGVLLILSMRNIKIAKTINSSDSFYETVSALLNDKFHILLARS